jgi:hypothetical protein
MAHNWKVYDLTRTATDGVVRKVTYGCEGVEGQHVVRRIGDLETSGTNEDEGFIAFETLTEATVLSWVFASIDKAAVESEITSELADIKALEEADDQAQGLPW